MFFSVKYINQNIEDFHNVLNHFFTELGTNNHSEFSDNLFPLNSRLKLYKRGNPALGYKKFVDSFKEIFKIYLSLTEDNRIKIIDAFFLSNKIEEICNYTGVNPMHYDEMDAEVKSVADFFNSFYDTYFEDFVDRQKHIEAFQKENGNICPVCGLSTSYQYDHFMPKGSENPIYPFSSVNPKNLIRICQACNGSKGSKLIIFRNNRRIERLVTFFPYSEFETWENLDFVLTNTSKPGVTTSGNWQVTFSPKNNGLTADQILKINRWKEFFKIEERFSKEIELGLKNWVQNFQAMNKTFSQMIIDTKPNRFNIKTINGILLQNLLFEFINSDNEMRNHFDRRVSTAENPLDLLMEQENN